MQGVHPVTGLGTESLIASWQSWQGWRLLGTDVSASETTQVRKKRKHRQSFSLICKITSPPGPCLCRESLGLPHPFFKVYTLMRTIQTQGDPAGCGFQTACKGAVSRA